MKTIGMIGGVSWESTAIYYNLINREVQKRLGGLHSAKIAMISVDFAELEALMRASQWDALAARLSDAAKNVERAGADVLLICANTMHREADRVAKAIAIPLLHICDCTARNIKEAGFKRVALLGTAYTMEQDFYKDRLRANGLDVIVPDAADRAVIHRVIFEELVLGKVKPESRSAYRDIIARQVKEGAEAIILGCTELPMLVKQEDSAVPLFDTTELHAMAAVDFALGAA
jgi:aspartate racemase